MAWEDCMLNPVGCAVESVAGEAAQSTWESFTQWVGQGLTDLASTVFEAFSNSTTPDFGVGWFVDYVDTLVLVSLPILALFFVLQVITGVIRREVGYLGRAVVGVMIGAAGVPIVLALVDGLSTFVDAASAYLIRRHSPEGFAELFEVSAVLAAGTGGGFVLVAMFLAIMSMLALYLVLLLRKVALLAIVVFAPIALVGWTWQSTRLWLRRWAEVTAALLISKFAMAVVFSLGLSAIAGAGQQDAAGSIGDLLAGVVLLGIAALAPWACFHFLHWAGTESATAMHSATHRGATSMRQQASQMQQVVHRATSTQKSGQDSHRQSRASSQSNGSGRAESTGSKPADGNGAASIGRGGKPTSASGASGAQTGAAASAGQSGGAGASAAGGAAAGVKVTHDVAKGVKQGAEKAGATTQQQVDSTHNAGAEQRDESASRGTPHRTTDPTPPDRSNR